jgi:hypothetical protein
LGKCWFQWEKSFPWECLETSGKNLSLGNVWETVGSCGKNISLGKVWDIMGILGKIIIHKGKKSPMGKILFHGNDIPRGKIIPMEAPRHDGGP